MEKIQSSGFYKAKILCVDDEQPILHGLKRHLTARGYEVRTANSGIQALEMLEESKTDLVILDLMMPGKSGLEVIREVRLKLHLFMPIVVLSAHGDERKKVEALDIGADDYLTKPFGLDELLARVRVALRHYQEVSAAAYGGSEAFTRVLGDKYLTIDQENHQVLVEGKETRLTPKQYDLLHYLALNEGKLLTHQQLLKNVWGADYGHEVSYLHVFVGQLRQKIEPNPAKPRFILTEPGLGYRFRLAEREETEFSRAVVAETSNLGQ